jgi:copper chaperone CopZ
MKIALLTTLITFSLSTFAAKVEVDVLGMTCGMCVSAITKELTATEKAEKIVVSLELKKATFDEIKGKKITDAEIKTAIKKAGYEAFKIRRF